MFAPNLTPEERGFIKWSFVGAIITSAVGALVDIGKDELKRAIENKRTKEASQ